MNAGQNGSKFIWQNAKNFGSHVRFYENPIGASKLCLILQKKVLKLGYFNKIRNTT